MLALADDPASVVNLLVSAIAAMGLGFGIFGAWLMKENAAQRTALTDSNRSLAEAVNLMRKSIENSEARDEKIDDALDEIREQHREIMNKLGTKM